MTEHVLVCMSDRGVGELIHLLLADAGYEVTERDLLIWLSEQNGTYPPADVIMLDAWPLRGQDALRRAERQLSRHPAPLILLVDGPSTNPVTQRLDASASLPLLFTQDELMLAVETAIRGVPAH